MAQQYIPPTYQPYQETRSRGSSHGSTDRYVPESYGGPAPTSYPAQAPPYPSSNAPPRVRGPSFGDSQIPSIAPVPEPQSFHAAPGGTQPYHPPVGGYPAINDHLHPAHAAMPPQQAPYPHSGSAGVDRDGYMRSPNPRRSSHSSNHSQRSHKSHHSRHSHDSRRSGHSHRSGHSRDGGHGRRSSDRERHSSDRERRSSDYDDQKRSRASKQDDWKKDRGLAPVKRVDSHRPSWGDSIYGMFHVIKDALGPRDKY